MCAHDLRSTEETTMIGKGLRPHGRTGLLFIVTGATSFKWIAAKDSGMGLVAGVT